MVSSDGVALWTCESPKGTQHDGPGPVCCLCIALGVGVDRRRACPHRRDVGPWYTAGANGVATVLGTLVLRGCVCVAIAVVGPTMVTPEGREAWEGEGTIWSYVLVYLRRCADGPLRPEG